MTSGGVLVVTRPRGKGLSGRQARRRKRALVEAQLVAARRRALEAG